jgi:hypothetical protein
LGQSGFSAAEQVRQLGKWPRRKKAPASRDPLLILTVLASNNWPEIRQFIARMGAASSSKEYREFADECMHWAKTARSDREKRIFLQMAETWLKAAVLADRREQRQATASKPQQSSGNSAEA